LGLVHLRSIYTPAGTGLSFSVVELDADTTSCPEPWSNEFDNATAAATSPPHIQQQLIIPQHPLIGHQRAAAGNVLPGSSSYPPLVNTTTSRMEKVVIMDRPVEFISKEEPSLMELSIDPESLGDMVIDDWPELELFDVDFELMSEGGEPAAAAQPLGQLVASY